MLLDVDHCPHIACWLRRAQQSGGAHIASKSRTLGMVHLQSHTATSLLCQPLQQDGECWSPLREGSVLLDRGQHRVLCGWAVIEPTAYSAFGLSIRVIFHSSDCLGEQVPGVCYDPIPWRYYAENTLR